MGRYTDTSIHLRMAWNRQHILNGGPKEATVPGWFLRVSRNEGYEDVVPETQISAEQAFGLAYAIDSILDINKTTVRSAVAAATKESVDELKKRLEYAEKQSALIPSLKEQIEKGSNA